MFRRLVTLGVIGLAAVGLGAPVAQAHATVAFLCYSRFEVDPGVWLERPPRKIGSIGIHLTKWVSTHGYALNVDLDPAPFTEWITACGLDDAAFTTMAAELGRPLDVGEVRPAAADALAAVFDLDLEDVPLREIQVPAARPALA